MRPMILPKATDKVQQTPRGTVLIPFQGSNKSHVVIELTRVQWLRLVADVELAFDRMAYQRDVQAALRDIDAQERLTMVGEKQRGGA